MTQDSRFTHKAQDFCADVLRRPDVAMHCSGPDMDKRGYLLSCLLDYRRNITTTSRLVLLPAYILSMYGNG